MAFVHDPIIYSVIMVTKWKIVIIYIYARGKFSYSQEKFAFDLNLPLKTYRYFNYLFIPKIYMKSQEKIYVQFEKCTFFILSYNKSKITLTQF